MLQAAVSARAIKSKGAANMSKINSYNACIYARLSRDDGDKLESDSIINQKALIRDFLSKHPEIHAVSEKTDDGYSGVNFDRPAFQEMMEDIRSGKINCHFFIRSEHSHCQISEVVSCVKTCLYLWWNDFQFRLVLVQPKHLLTLHATHEVRFCDSHYY